MHTNTKLPTGGCQRAFISYQCWPPIIHSKCLILLNAAKTEIAWFGSRVNLNKISGSDLCLPVGSNVIKPREVVRDLGVYLGSELSFRQHITKVANSCFHHLRRLRQIRRSIDEDVTIQLVVAFVLSRIDYCNAVLAALPRSTI